MGIFVYPKQSMLFTALWCAAIVSPSLSLSSVLATVGTGIFGGGKQPAAVASLSLRAGGVDTADTIVHTEKRPRTAVIVGGGPGGLAAALVLSNVKKPPSQSPSSQSSHSADTDTDGFLFDKIVVLDEAPKEAYDPTRAYFFNINRRGQTFTNLVGIDLSVRGTGVTQFAKHTVPADPREVFDASATPFSRPMSDTERDNIGTLYWIPRHELVELITDEILKTQQHTQKGGGGAVIEFRRNTRCEHIEPTTDEDDGSALVKIVLNNGDGVLMADLCVGADGANSSVRKSLEDGRFDALRWSNAHNAATRFRLKRYVTPSTGLRIKGMRVSPDFAIPKGGTEEFDAADKEQEMVPLGPGYSYFLDSTTTGSRDKLRLSILPQKDPHSMAARPINICTEPDHDIWNPSIIKQNDGGKSAKEFFRRAHPRYDWDGIVAADEWAVFAATEGSRFPPCQHSPGLYVAAKSGGAGVVLLGDALHSFPPDTGQGVNAAFCDVMALKASFEEAARARSAAVAPTAATQKSFVEEALRNYQKTNGPETRALVALARCGAPFQYGQASVLNRFRAKLWTANVVLRIFLNKVTLEMSPKPAILMSLDPTMSFRRIMRKANTLTAVLWSSFLLAVLSLARAKLRL